MKRLLPLLVLCGCTLGPDYKRPQLELPAQYPEPAPAAAQALAPQWWQLYSDKTLDGLIDTAQKANADVRLAAARVQEAEGALREARAALFPEVTGSYTYARSQMQ